jgi:hypothetical protein
LILLSRELLNPVENRQAALAPDTSLRLETTCRHATKLRNFIELASDTGHREVNMLNRYYNATAEALAASWPEANQLYLIPGRVRAPSLHRVVE